MTKNCTECKWKHPDTCKICKQDEKAVGLDEERIITWYTETTK